MGQTALLPFQRKACWGFFRPENPTASAGFEPANLGTKGQHATSRPPKPLFSCLLIIVRHSLSCEVATMGLYILLRAHYVFILISWAEWSSWEISLVDVSVFLPLTQHLHPQAVPSGLCDARDRFIGRPLQNKFSVHFELWLSPPMFATCQSVDYGKD